MTNQQLIQILQSSEFKDEEGEEFVLHFHKGLSEEEINELEKKFPNQHMEKELKDLLRITKGWEDLILERVDFTSINEDGFKELIPESITLGYDGFGNSWVLDLSPEGKLGHVFYASHDPAVIIKQSENLNEFLEHLVEFYSDPENSHLDNIHDNFVDRIWEHQHQLTSFEDFKKQNNGDLDFLNKEVGEWVIADLRNAKNGEGFPYGKYGPSQPIIRHPKQLIWAIDKTPKTGLLNWMFE